MAVDFVVVVPLHFWQSGQVGGSLLFFLVWFVFLTTCELFEQAGFCGSEIYLLIYSVFLCRVCCI